MGRNQNSGEYWTTKQIIPDLLSYKDKIIIDWLTPNSEPLHIRKAFLVQVTESSDIERLFSVFTQQHSTLNQASNPTQVEEMVVTQKESPSCEQFDSTAALTIWEKQKQTRHIKLPSTNYSLQPNKEKVG